MLRLQDIQKELFGLVGWEQGFGPNVIDDSLLTSESGLTYQGAHPLVTLENIRQIMPTDWGATDWANNEQYFTGQAVFYQGRVWIAKQGSMGVVPTNGDTWIDSLSWYVTKLTNDGINTTIQTFITQKQLNRETRNLVDRRAFFDGAARLAATIDPKGKIVGFEIQPVRAMGVTMKIEKIGLQIIWNPLRTRAVGVTPVTWELPIYLFHSSRRDPVSVFTLSIVENQGTFQWYDVDLNLPYMGEDTDTGGAWFLCYNQNDLPSGAYALNVSKDWSKSPCETCYGYALESWKEITEWMMVSPFCVKAPTTFSEYPEMFDIGALSYTNTMNYGLNCVVTIGCDLTDFIISQRAIFAQVLQKQVAANVLRTMAMNPETRVNRNQANITREGILYEVDGNPQGRASGLGWELAEAYKALSLDTRGLDRVCLKCTNNGARYRTV